MAACRANKTGLPFYGFHCRLLIYYLMTLQLYKLIVYKREKEVQIDFKDILFLKKIEIYKIQSRIKEEEKNIYKRSKKKFDNNNSYILLRKIFYFFYDRSLLVELV